MRRKLDTVCHTCRAHKIGCDGKRPTCSQCLLTGRRCAGYQLDNVFVAYTPRSSSLRSKPLPTIGCPANPQSKSKCRSSCHHKQHREFVYSDSLSSAIPRPISSATPEEFAAVIVNCFMPADQPDPLAFDVSTARVCGAWVDILPHLIRTPGYGKLLSSAISAFGSVILDNGPQGKEKSFRSLEAYAATLHGLRKALVSDAQLFNIENAIAILCLAMVELMLPTSHDGVYTHFNGLGALIEACPPELFSLNIFHLVFAGCRPGLLFHHISQRKSTFLEQSRWKSEPFRHHAPSIIQMLLSDVAGLPSILEKIDRILNLPHNTVAWQDRVISEARVADGRLGEILKMLLQWEAYLNDDSCHDCPMEVLEKVSHHVPTTQFAGLMSANTHLNVWAFQMICLVEKEKLYMSLRSCISNDLLWTMPSHQQTHAAALAAATKILRSVGYLLEDQKKLFGPAASLFPLKIAYEVLRGHTDHNKELLARYQDLVDLLRCRGFQTNLFS